MFHFVLDYDWDDEISYDELAYFFELHANELCNKGDDNG